jgi:DNA replication protein DnaC
MAVARIPIKYWCFGIDDIEDRQVRSIVSKYVSKLPEIFDRGYGLYFCGNNGTGKTLCASLILKEALRQDFSARFTHLSEVLKMFCDGMYDRELREEYQRQILSVDFLVVDDIDKSYENTQSRFLNSSYDNLFRTRANNCLPTIITANQKRDKVLEDDNGIFGKSLLSLFAEHIKDVPVIGRDRRKSRISSEVDEFFE